MFPPMRPLPHSSQLAQTNQCATTAKPSGSVSRRACHAIDALNPIAAALTGFEPDN